MLGTNADAPGVGAFVQAGGVLNAAATHADLREATDLVARSAQEMGLDRFQPFLRRADDHLTQTGGLLALLRDVPAPRAPALAPPPSAMPTGPRLPPPGQLGPLLRTVLRGAGLAVIAAGLLDAYARQEQERQLRDVIERFRLDPANPADAAAALAFRWAQNKGPWLFDTLRAAAQGAAAPGSGIETRTDEERSLVAQMMGEGKSGAEIQAALDQHRANGKETRAEERRNTPGVAVASTPLPRIEGSWLTARKNSNDGAPIPAQVAEKLVGRRFSSFGELRAAIWKAIAETPELARDFSDRNLRLMRNGNAPYPPNSEQVVIRSTGKLSQRTWELHHDPAIRLGGAVYDLSTMRVVTPQQHDRIESKGKLP